MAETIPETAPVKIPETIPQIIPQIMPQIMPMEARHLPQVCDIEHDCFPIPWSRREFEREFRENKLAVYFVACEDGEVIGYAGMWHVVNEGHITNIAVREDKRRRGVGGALVQALVDEAGRREMAGLTLEVRISNTRAQRLYARHGFKVEGFRKNYYDDTHEDAIIMWKTFITQA